MNNNSIYIDVFFIALVYLVGYLGINFLGLEYSSIFIKTSFISILIPLSLYLLRTTPSIKEWSMLFSAYVLTFVSECAGVTSTRIVEIYNADSQKLLVKSKTKWCMTDPQTQRPKRIPNDILTIFD